MSKVSIEFPQIRVEKFQSQDFTTFHLIINNEYAGCFRTKAEVLERISQLAISEVSIL